MISSAQSKDPLFWLDLDCIQNFESMQNMFLPITHYGMNETGQSQSLAEIDYDLCSTEEWNKITNQLDLNIDDRFLAWINEPECEELESTVETVTTPKQQQTIFPCFISDEVVDNKSELKNLLESKDTNLVCEYVQCQKTFTTSATLKKHLHKHSDMSRSFVCVYCTMRFTTETSLKTHHTIYHKEVSLTCDICGKQFELKRHFNQHVADHSNTTTKYECKICSLEYRKGKYLMKHYKAVHPNSKQRQNFEVEYETKRARRIRKANANNTRKQKQFSKQDLKTLFKDSISRVSIPIINKVIHISDDEEEVNADEKPSEITQEIAKGVQMNFH